MANEIYELAEKVLQSKPQEGTIPEKSIVVSPDERRRLEQILGKNLNTGKDLVQLVERSALVSVDGVTVVLSPFLRDRLQTRAIRVPYEQFIENLVKRLLEEYAGLR